MQERLELRGGVEVSGLAPQHDVRGESGAGCDVLAERGVLVGQQHEPAQGEACREHQDERGENAPHPAPVEPGEAEASAPQVIEDDARDEEARDDEEDIDAGEAAGGRAREGVERHHRQDGDGAQPVDVGPVGVRARTVQAAGLSSASSGAAGAIRSRTTRFS